MALPAGRADRRRWRALLAEAVRHIDEAIARLAAEGDERHAAPRRRDQGRAPRSRTSTTTAMAALLEVERPRERIARRELYRRCSRIGEIVVDVAERVIYAVVKQS